MRRKPSPTTLPPSDDHATKAQKAKAVVLSGVAVVAREPSHALLTHTPRFTHETIAPKVKEKTERAKAKTTHHAPLALANPNLTLVLTVVAGLTTLAIVSSALLMKTKEQHQSNKPIKTS